MYRYFIVADNVYYIVLLTFARCAFLIYFDNAATTFFKPQEVINAAVNTIKNLSVNPGRAAHFLSVKGSALMWHARTSLADFFGCDDPSRVIFTSGCTHALNAAIFGSNLYGKHVITTALEHNAVLRPLFELKRRGHISLTVIYPGDDGTIDPSSVLQAIRQTTAMVAMTHVSNVTGAVNPVEKTGEICYKNGIFFLVDAAQSAGHIPLDVKKCHIDMLALPAHKGLHALPGCGALILSEKAEITPFIFGGTGTNSSSLVQPASYPEGLEAGTLNLPGIAAMARAANLCKSEFSARKQKLETLTRLLFKGLSEIKGVRIYSPESSPSGIVSFNLSHLDSGEVADILSEKHRACVRSGLHCAPLLHRATGTEQKGMVRASLSFYNTEEEVAEFVKATKEISAATK